MSAGRGVDADQSGHHQDVFYLFVLYHIRISIGDLPFYGLLAEYQEVFTGPWPGKGVDRVVKSEE